MKPKIKSDERPGFTVLYNVSGSKKWIGTGREFFSSETCATARFNELSSDKSSRYCPTKRPFNEESDTKYLGTVHLDYVDDIEDVEAFIKESDVFDIQNLKNLIPIIEEKINKLENDGFFLINNKVISCNFSKIVKIINILEGIHTEVSVSQSNEIRAYIDVIYHLNPKKEYNIILPYSILKNLSKYSKMFIPEDDFPEEYKIVNSIDKILEKSMLGVK